jgi:hypothetical protein
MTTLEKSMRQILFIQGGGGTDVHDTWDDKLVDSLTRALGDEYDVRYPRMPDEDDPSYAKWRPAITREVAALGDGAVVVGHSIGGAMLVNALAERSSKIPPLDGEDVGNRTIGDGSISRHGRGDRGRRAGLSSHPHPTSPIEGEESKLAAIVLVSAPFVGEGGWPGDEFTTPPDLGAKLPDGVPVHLFQGEADDTTPAEHAALYARAAPQAKLHRLPGRDHQLNNDLSEVAEVVRGLGD